MDWTELYDNSAEEHGRWEEKEKLIRYSHRTGILATLQSGTYSPLIAYLFTVNYILGVGCLGVPFAFLKSGIILGTISILVCSFFSFLTVIWVAQSSNRAMRSKIRTRGNAFQSPKPSRRTSATTSIVPKPLTEIHSLLPSISTSGSLNDLYQYMGAHSSLSERDSSSPSKSSRITSRKSSWQDSKRNSYQMASKARDYEIVEPEVTETAQLFLGDFYALYVYQGSLGALAYIGLLAYCQVFSQGCASMIWPAASSEPGITDPTRPPSVYTVAIPLIIFSAIVIPLSLYDLNEQIHVQVVMSMLRFASLGILLFGTLAAFWLDPRSSSDGASSSGSGSGEFVVPMFDTDGFSLMFTTAVFSQLFQHSVPGLIRPLSYEHRTKVPTIFASALGTTAAIYIGMGCVATYYFQDSMMSSINLNFSGYYWGVQPDSVYRPLAAALSLTVVLFPALDTLSVFPLIANTLGNNLMAGLPAGLLHPMVHALRTTWCMSTAPHGTDAASAEAESAQHEEKEVQRWTVSLFRLLAAVPPILLSAVITDLTVSLQLAGFTGIIVALVTPALLQISSSRDLNSADHLNQSSLFSSGWDHPILPYLALTLSGVAFAVCIAQFFM